MELSLKILSLLHLLALFHYIGAADIDSAEKAADVSSEDIKAADTEDDLETEETGWTGMMMDPIQKKLQEIEYVKTKLLSPFMTLKSPTYNYGGSYPVYSSSGSGGYSTGTQISNNGVGFAVRPQYYWSKPQKTYGPSYTQNVWHKKGYTGINVQQGAATYAPNCDPITSSWKPISVSVPVNPTYSAGTPLTSYHSSASPTQIYGTPLVNFAAKSTISSSSIQSGPAAPLSQTIAVPVLVSDTIVLKSTDPRQLDSTFQNVNPSSYWTSTGSLPSAPSWSSASGSLPSQVSSFNSNPAWSGASGYVPLSTGAPQPPAAVSSFWSGASGNNPIPVSGSQVSSYIPTSANPSSWSSITPSSQQLYQTSSTPFSTIYSQGSQSSTTPFAQQYFVVPPISTSSTASDQGVVRIAPPPIGVKSNYVSTLPGPNIIVPVDASEYSPGSSYVGSYYPNVFYITNEQHVDKPNTPEVGDQGRSALQLQPSGDNSNSSEKTPMSSDTSSLSTTTLTTTQVLKSPSQTVLYTSNPSEQPKFTVYSIPPPAVSSNGYYSYPVQGSYPIPVSSSLLGTSSTGASQSQILPATRIGSPVNSYPIPIGYRYSAPPIAFQTGFQSQLTTKTSPPC